MSWQQYLLLVVALAMPAFALEVKWGGLFRARVLTQDTFTSGTRDYNMLWYGVLY